MTEHNSLAAYCADLLKRHEPDHYLISLFAGEEDRLGLAALLAFNSEVGRIRGLVSEPALGQIRLQWWRDTIRTIYRAGPAAPAGIAAALAGLIRRRSLPLERFEALLDAHEADLLPRPFQTDTEFEAYLDAAWGNLFVLASMALGGGEADLAARAAYEAGLATGYGEIAKTLARSGGRASLLVPLERLARFGVRAEDIENGRRPPELAALVADLIACARSHLARARDGGFRPPRHRIAPFLLASLAEGDLAAIEAAGCDPGAVRRDRRALSRAFGVWWRSLFRSI